MKNHNDTSGDDSPFARKKNEEINKLIAKLDDGKTTKYLDIGAKFLNSEQCINKAICLIYLHPSSEGYELWAEAIECTLQQMLGGSDKTPKKK